MVIDPSVGWTKPAIIISNVLLPQPLGPRRLRNSPFATSMDTSRIASVSSNSFRTFRTRSKADSSLRSAGSRIHPSSYYQPIISTLSPTSALGNVPRHSTFVCAPPKRVLDIEMTIALRAPALDEEALRHDLTEFAFAGSNCCLDECTPRPNLMQ